MGVRMTDFLILSAAAIIEDRVMYAVISMSLIESEWVKRPLENEEDNVPLLSYVIVNFFYLHPKCLTYSDDDFPERASLQVREGCSRVREIIYFINHRFNLIAVYSLT